MSSTEYNVGDLVAEFLSLCGVTTAVGVVSIHNIPMLDGIGRRNAIRFVMARGELGGGHMADGYARVTGKLGAFFSSTGPGAANAVGSLIEARYASTPMLHLTGQTATKFVDRGMGTVHDAYEQLDMLASVSKSAYRIRSAEQALGVLMRAAADALTPPMGPVSVEVPIDIQRTPIRRPAELDAFALPLPAPLAPAEAAMSELAERVARAKRPMLWLGAGARHAGGAAARLLDMGFGMVTSLQGRGSVSENHPLNLGGFNGNGQPLIEALYQEADLMVVVGSRLRGHETGDFAVKLPAELLQIDADPLANGRTYPTDFFVCADARLALEALVQRLQGRIQVDAAFTERVKAVKERVREEFAASLGPYATFAEQVRRVMPRDAIWVRDVTISNTTWGHRLFPVYGAETNVYPVGAGIGQGLQLGIGAALGANGRKVVAMTGDGGFFLNVGELWTAVQEKLDMVVMVMNDRGYGVIKHIQNALYGGRNYYADLMGPDLGDLAKVAGVPFWKVQQPDALGSAVEQALATKGPTLVEVDMKAIGEIPPYHPFNKPAPARA
jgi:acetolactate synthase-1/2/3 large subunit